MELYFWILLALDLGSGRAVHSPFFCSKFTLSLLNITLECGTWSLSCKFCSKLLIYYWRRFLYRKLSVYAEDKGLTLDDCCLFHRCFYWHFYQIFLWNRSRVRLERRHISVVDVLYDCFYCFHSYHIIRNLIFVVFNCIQRKAWCWLVDILVITLSLIIRSLLEKWYHGRN